MTITEKADRLLLTGSVSIPAVTTATVRGDHGEHLLYRVDTGRWRCTCPARKRCSHIEAVERVT
jgi:hypothetical protein